MIAGAVRRGNGVDRTRMTHLRRRGNQGLEKESEDVTVDVRKEMMMMTRTTMTTRMTTTMKIPTTITD